jgi:hypothetical protein
MKVSQGIRIWLGAAVLTAALAGVAVSAHSVTYHGTVLAVEAARVQVKTVDDASRKEETLWFVVDKDTKIRRGDEVVTYAAARIVKGERIAVTIDHDAATKMLATEIRLAPAKEAHHHAHHGHRGRAYNSHTQEPSL